MKCVVLYNSCDKERFENILKWNALSYCEFWGICCDDYSGVNEIVKKKDEITKAVHESDFMMVIAGEIHIHALTDLGTGYLLQSRKMQVVERNSSL